jgi:hypothetical protein
MTNIINQAKIKQRSVFITLLDLKNAFGEVHHNLIQSVLDYHHIPKDVSEIIKSLYTDFNTTFITLEFSTPFITGGRGVLQRDCLSPLIFNMCINNNNIIIIITLFKYGGLIRTLLKYKLLSHVIRYITRLQYYYYIYKIQTIKNKSAFHECRMNPN